MTARPPTAHSLSKAELAWLEQQIRALPGRWSLDVLREPGELSAVLMPEDGDRFAPTFLIERTPGGYRLQACRWDVMSVVGVFPAFADSLALVATAALAAAEATPSPRLH